MTLNSWKKKKKKKADLRHVVNLCLLAPVSAACSRGHFQWNYSAVIVYLTFPLYYSNVARRAGSVGSMSASGLAGPGFDPRRSGKFSFEKFQPRS